VVWVFLEILAALAVAVAIVWWTMPRKSRKESARPGAGEEER